MTVTGRYITLLMSRTTWSMTDEAAQSLEDAAAREDDESATDFILRVAEIVSEVDNGTTVTEPLRSGEDMSGCDVPEDVLTEAHLKDIRTIVDRRVEQLEENLR